MKAITKLAGVSALALAMGVSLSANAASKSETPFSTPPGITLVNVSMFINNSSAQFLWRRIGAADGKPLYSFVQDSGAPTCVAECAKEFVAYKAPNNAQPYGDWTVVNHPEAGKQWAYQGKPLYTYTGTDPVGEPRAGGANGGSTETPEFFDGSSKMYSPKEGWTRVAFTPEKTAVMPAGVELKQLPVANGYGFVTADTGMPTYVLKSAPKDNALWTPVYAPVLALPVGEFSIIDREDGKRQWAYKGDPMYTFKGDYTFGDANGTVVQKDAQVALAYKHFMPAAVNIGIYELRGPLMTNTKGITLYTQSRYHLQYGGREMRDGYRYTYNDAKAVGTKGCADPNCLKTWKPLLAPANAQAQGFWEVESRADGTKQWSYRGSPLYTYVGDKKPGDIGGNNRHDIVYGDPEGKIDLSVTGGNNDSKYDEGSGFYWHTATLYN